MKDAAQVEKYKKTDEYKQWVGNNNQIEMQFKAVLKRLCDGRKTKLH